MALFCSEKLLFLSNKSYLASRGGGVQWCTCEYLNTLQAAGFEVIIHDYLPDSKAITKLLRKLRPRPFSRIVPPYLPDEVIRRVAANKIHWIAYNNTEACAIAERVRNYVPGVKQLFLSHGAEITDEINILRLSPTSTTSHLRSARWIGQSLLAQVGHRQAFDASICISAQDVEFERWLGASNVIYLPRQVRRHLLKWRPQPGVIGTVATLDHAPNRHGIEAVASYLSGSELQLRLVGGPERIGRTLQAKYPCIHYCGRLSDEALEAEAATWMAFINPIFCQARGSSTKVARALGWGLPVISTQQGVRGYVWNDEALPLADSARGLADLALSLALKTDPAALQERALSVVRLAPTLEHTADQLATFLMGLP